MGVSQPPPFMNANVNMTVTIFGFALSGLFMFIICCRLICFRFSSRDVLGASRHTTSLVERAVQGLEMSAIASFPTIKYSSDIFVSSEDNLCTICLGEYEEEEVLRVLPRCGHAFHVACVDAWLRHHPTCPVCRVSLQAFPDWRRVSGPLISVAARKRFAAGAIPDMLFEQPRVQATTGSAKEAAGGAHHKEAIVRKPLPTMVDRATDHATASARGASPCHASPRGYKAFVEMAESSLARHHQASVAAAEKLVSRPCSTNIMASFDSFGSSSVEDTVQTVKSSAVKEGGLSIVSQS